MKDATVKTPQKVFDHLTEQFTWTNKKHLAEKFMKTETTCPTCGQTKSKLIGTLIIAPGSPPLTEEDLQTMGIKPYKMSEECKERIRDIERHVRRF